MANGQGGNRDGDGLETAASVARRADAKTWLKIIFILFILVYEIVAFFVRLLARLTGRAGVVGVAWAVLGPTAMLAVFYLLRAKAPFDELIEQNDDGAWEPTRSGSILLVAAFASGVVLLLTGIVLQFKDWRRRRSLAPA